MEYIYGATVVAFSITVGATTWLYFELQRQKMLVKYYKSKYDLIVDSKLIQLLFEGENDDGQ